MLTVFVANRRYDRAIGLAQRFGGSAVRFDDLPEQLAEADIVVSCTASPHLILGRDELELTMAERDGRPLVLIDIAVPRDVDADGARPAGGRALRHGRPAACGGPRPQRARGGGHSAPARSWPRRCSASTAGWPAWTWCPPIAALRERGDEIVEAVLAENETRWESLSESDRERLRVMARAVVGRMLHEPTLRLKGAAEADESHVLRARAARAVRAGGAGARPRGRAALRGGHRARVSPRASARE